VGHGHAFGVPDRHAVGDAVRVAHGHAHVDHDTDVDSDSADARADDDDEVALRYFSELAGSREGGL
jgi:hypothetical protein